ncbi:MAG: zinc-binding dehydrogenase [Bacilli bacterium]
MKAMLVDKNKNLVWSEVKDPILEEDKIIVKIYAVALNRADLLQREGKYPSPKGWPTWMGLELSGEIIEMGKKAQENTNFKVGDKVCALVGGGAYAEKIAIPYQLVLPVPEGLTMEEASAIPEAYVTSYLNLFEEGKLQKGQIVYIAAGASGLASAAIPMAKAYGATVVTSVMTNEIKEKINHLNADYVIVQEKESIPEVFKRFEEEGHPINVAMDCLAGKDMGEAISYMARGGYWVIISTLAGVTSEIQLRPILTKGLHLVGSMLRNRSNEEKEKLLKNLQRDFFKYFKDGTIKPSIYKILDIAQVEEAHNILLTNKNVGKVVLKIG